MKATYLNYHNLVDEYVKLKYPDKIIVVLCDVFYHTGSYTILSVLGLSFTEISTTDYAFVEFETEEEAIDFCNKIPDSQPYAVVFRNGKAIHENT